MFVDFFLISILFLQAPVSTIGDDIGSTSHTQAGTLNNITSQSLIVPSNFVDLNIDGDSLFFLVSKW